MSEQQTSDFYREYNLTKARKHRSTRTPAVHQNEALQKLHEWFEDKPSPYAGAILTLPTGGGKTFTAVRFLCTGPLSKGYRVLWLAHTHHLLEQAFYNYGPEDEDDPEAKRTGYEVGWIAEPKRQLNVRVVSGTKGHFRVPHIKPSDNIVICTVQTATRAYKKLHPELVAFLDAAGDKLVVVFDEAHHSPAPSYRKLILDLRENRRGMYLLGLTATPTYGDEKKRGWLKRLFPQDIVYQIPPGDLVPPGILAEPVLQEFRTDFTPAFDESEYEKWLGTYRDIPEEIVTKLALSQERNALIANTYVKHRARYGKTIIFAERWFQCDQLREFLRTRGVKADVIYSHVDTDPGSAEARNKRHKDENAQVLDAFRHNKLDVLVNVRMLTEGTDVPDVQTVFLTRQTTSKILLTQMAGRALRGPKFGGTEKAYIVSFIDNWMHLINWAEYDQLDGGIDPSIPEYGKRPPLHLISIDLVRRLVRQMDTGELVALDPFLSFIPIGWYRVEFVTTIKGSDDHRTVRQLVMVFDKEEKSYRRFVSYLKRANLAEFIDEGISLDAQQECIEGWRERFFSKVEAHLGEDLLTNLFHVARHIAQNDGDLPVFFPFEERKNHDLDALAQKSTDDGLDRFTEDQLLQNEYAREDRYWKTIYPNYELFWFQYEAGVNRILRSRRPIASPEKVIGRPELIPDREPSDEIKKEVKKRDGNRCLCCGSKFRLEIDHIIPSYYGGKNSPDNLQTLCRICNGMKSDETINFQKHKSPLRALPSPFDFPKPREPRQAKDAEQWKQSLCRSINFFYHCAAVKMSSARIKSSGRYFRHWEIQLYADIDPSWLEPWLAMIVREVRHVRKEAKLQEGLEGITVKTSKRQVSYSIKRGVR